MSSTLLLQYKDYLIESLEAALVTAYKKNFDSVDNVRVEINKVTGEIHIFAVMDVVEESEDPLLEISLKDAKKINKKAAVGEKIDVEIVPKDFGRIAAGTAKQVITQKLREKEKSSAYGEFENKVDTLMTGIVNYPTDEYFYTKIIMYYNDTEKWEELEGFVTDMIDKDPNKAYNYFVVGVLKQQQKDYETAAKNYEIAVEKDPELADAYINLGLCYMFLANEYVDANSNVNYRSAAYKKVLEVEKEFYQKALPMYEKVEKLLPNDVDKWGPQLYQIYYKLNMSKETSRMETILKAEGLL